MNLTMLIGRLVAQPELIKTPKDKSLVRVTIAVNRRYKNADGLREADFISLAFWNKLAENFVSYAKKGSLIAVEGEIRSRTYLDKDEQKRYITEVVVSNYELLESRATVTMREKSRPLDAEKMSFDAEELPF